jgi:hypothetical protein
MENHATVSNGSSGVGGWLLVLCVWLLAWQPISLGVVASNALRSLPFRGTSLAVIVLVRVLVAAVGVAAGIGLLTRRPAAVTIAQLSLALSAAGDTLAYTSSSFPSNRAPGETPFYVVGTLIFYGTWAVYLGRSKRVRKTYDR